MRTFECQRLTLLRDLENEPEGEWPVTQETTSFVYVTYIRVTSEKVFEAITRPDIARRYWGHENVSDWTPGCRWEHDVP